MALEVRNRRCEFPGKDSPTKCLGSSERVPGKGSRKGFPERVPKFTENAKNESKMPLTENNINNHLGTLINKFKQIITRTMLYECIMLLICFVHVSYDMICICF